MDPYTDKNQKSIIFKPPVAASLCSVHGTRRTNRGIRPILQKTRVVERGEVHEIIVVDEDASDDKPIEQTAYIGFAEFLSGGLLKCGDKVYINNKYLGYLTGFDDTHMPNHLNILIRRNQRVTGVEIDCKFCDLVLFYEESTSTQ